jgi:hypothetical protein
MYRTHLAPPVLVLNRTEFVFQRREAFEEVPHSTHLDAVYSIFANVALADRSAPGQE